jgi:hypothetical protein
MAADCPRHPLIDHGYALRDLTLADSYVTAERQSECLQDFRDDLEREARTNGLIPRSFA